MSRKRDELHRLADQLPEGEVHAAVMFLRYLLHTYGAEENLRRVPAEVSREGSLYVARALDVEVVSQGETVFQALNNLREALELFYEDTATTIRFEIEVKGKGE